MVENGRRVLAGRYEVGELVGRGGMAEVHIGHDARLGRTVAIKILRSDLARDPSFLARFRREAQAAASLNHPAIVAVYDTGEDEYKDAQGNPVHVPFIVMEYVEGHTVRDVLRDGQAVPIDEAIEITAGVLSALEYSHHAGIVHRDIKPANVMITPTGAIKVMDFGIARAVADSAATMTQTQAVIGTAQYLSPEQARGETVDARSDLYSTGCLLFELLTGRTPFIGDSPVAVAYQHVRETPATPSSLAPDVPEVLDRITMKALAKERSARYSSAAEFRADLESALRGEPVNVPMVAAGALAAADLQPTVVESATQVMAPASAPPAVAPSPWATTTGLPPTDPPGETEEEEEKPKRKGLMWALIAVGVVALATIITLLIINSGGKKEPETVVVPTITAEMTPAQAKAAIEAAGLEYDQRSEDSDQPKDTFLRQNPAGDTEVKPGSTVQVWFSPGPQSVNVPNVKGMTQEEANREFDKVGLKMGTVTPEDSPDVPKNAITRTEPAGGATATPGQQIAVYISTGNVSLPNLRGMSQADAERTVRNLQLEPSVTQQESDETAGTVINQSPGQGSVPQGSTVNLTVAKAREQEMTTVPRNLAGMTEQQAQEALGGAGLNVGPPQRQNNDTIPKDIVMGSDPGGGKEVPVGTSVSLIISDGPAGGGGG